MKKGGATVYIYKQCIEIQVILLIQRKNNDAILA